MRIGILAGETSGDQLGAGLIRAIKHHAPHAVFEGIAGPKMIEAGCSSFYPMEKLSVLGIVEVIKHYRELKAIRDHLIEHFIDSPPDVFIGIDLPDFNLPMERKLKEAGIPTVHYVSPTVWAWRPGRVHGIAKSVNLMLTMFPFENEIYEQHNVPVEFVGNPIADMFPMQPDRTVARHKLDIPEQAKVIALLPGSRVSELQRHADLFIKTATWCHEKNPDVQFIVPLASKELRHIFENTLQQLGTNLPITLFDGQSHDVLMACDAVLLASGTAAVEAMLMKRPMVVTYKLNWLSYRIMKAMLNVPYVCMPNNLAGSEIAPEFIQHNAKPEKMGPVLLDYLEHPEKSIPIIEKFTEIHQTLRKNADETAALAVLKLVTE
ncbi:MAG: lipid-A-disaccharide synthase [Gammaproteobacteria bacterium]|nr:lipid-A-disaccharide synthase [Gammaproteobacteria bacterium]MDH5593530.1 lipid-A-disaccharide synthase [Gammaproteobacteria bacterium]MDH5614417.1 lipid-A-disaccharide synthase [Gammaproteobacteria bacterium]